jgi:hypothetical protein
MPIMASHITVIPKSKRTSKLVLDTWIDLLYLSLSEAKNTV